MSLIIAILCATIVTQGVISYLRDQANTAERAEMQAEMRRVMRQSMRAVMARNGHDFDAAEARGALIENMGNRPARPERDDTPAYEGLG